MDIDQRLHDAVQKFWDGRGENLEKQTQRGIADAGTRGAVTAGTQMRALETLVADIICDAGIQRPDIRSNASVELPGYFRPEKKWDLVVVSQKQLVLAMEFKSMVGSFGKNLNNRSEEAIGSAKCLWTAYREGRLGSGPAPFLGYFFLLEDHSEVHGAKKYKERNFDVDPIFKAAGQQDRRSKMGVSYGKRFEILCRRLVLERLYSATCLILATNEKPTKIAQPADDLSFQRFVAGLRGHARTFVESQK